MALHRPGNPLRVLIGQADTVRIPHVLAVVAAFGTRLGLNAEWTSRRSSG
jgi:hypothetical protein